ncbi:MAG: hypothetical protein ABIJ97_11205, partial [Bacteroidota bacterium]
MKITYFASMLKKGIIIGVIILVIASVVLISYKYMKKQTIVSTEIYNAVPVSTAFFIESRNFSGLIKNIKSNLYWPDLMHIPYFNKLNLQIKFLENLISTNSSLDDMLKNQPVIISAHLNGKNNYSFLFFSGLSGIFGEDQVIDLLKNKLEGKANIIERNYNNKIIYDVKMNSNEEPGDFSFAICDNIFILSFSSILVEDALRQMGSSASLSNMSDFRKVSSTAGKNVDANIFINYKTFNKLFSLFLDKPFNNYLSNLNHFAYWTEVDVCLKKDQILLNGFTFTNDSMINYLNLFLKQDPVKIKIEQILPANTSTFLSLGISNYKEYHNERIKYLQDIGKYDKFNEEINGIKKDIGIDIIEFFNNIFEEEAALAYTDINSADLDQNAFIIIKTKSKSIAEEELIKLLVSYSDKRKINIETLSSICKIDNETSFPVYKMPISNIGALVLGDFFNAFETHYFSFYDNYLILSKTETGLKSFIHSNILQKNLDSDIVFNELKDNLSSKSNVLFYSNPGPSFYLHKKYLESDLKISLDSNIDVLRKFQAVAYQLFPSKNMLYNNLILKYNPVVKEKPRTMWESKLDTTTSSKPKILINHNTNEKEIFVQDDNNTIYLISDAGRILWKLKIDSPIMSDVIQVDCYKNGKFQMLFNTKNKLYIIDRLGNYLTNFPVDLRAPATNGLAIFDYEDDRNYRIFIACHDKKVYAYDIEGKIIKGWEFDKTDKYVYQPIQHFRIKDADYLIFADSMKTYILDRKGSEKVKPESYITQSKNNIFYLDKNSKDNSYSFLTTDIEGNIINISTDGKIETLTLHKCDKDYYFDFNDFDGDGANDYIYTNDKEVVIYNTRKIKIFEASFPSKITQKPYLYIFPNNNRKLGLVIKDNNEIY